MTRVLVLTGPKATTRFTLLYTALLNGGDGKGDRSAATIRKEARMLDQFDAISEPVNGNPDIRTLNDGEHTVVLPSDDFDLLVQYAEKTPWTPRVARQAVELWEWLPTVERQD